MCGILGCVVRGKDTKSVMKNLYEIFMNQKSRGIQGAGISIGNNDSSLFRFRSVSPFRLFNVYNYDVWANIVHGSRVLIHHRFPTSSENEPMFNHPISNEDGTVHVIHNGILMNEHELYDRLKAQHVFETKEKNSKRFTDTEVIVHVFEEGYEIHKDVVKALKHVYKTIRGSFALAFNIKGVDGIYLMKNNMPIIISEDEQGNIFFSSEFDKKVGLKKVHELVEGEIGFLDNKGYNKILLNELIAVEKKKYDWSSSFKNETGKQWKNSKNSKKDKKNFFYDDNFGFVDYDLPYGSNERWW